MIGFCVKGGIGDAILATPVVRKIREMFDDEVAILHFDRKSAPILESTGCRNIRLIEKDEMEPSEVFGALSDCKLIVWNSFKIDNDGHCNLFYALDDSMISFVREKRELYLKNLSRDFGSEIKDMRSCAARLLVFFSKEDNYYSDFNRFGFHLKHEDVHLNIPQNVISRNFRRIEDLGKYCIVHDSRLTDPKYSFKSWYADRWKDLVYSIKEIYEIEVVHMKSSVQETFSDCVSHQDLIGPEAEFFDYLYLLSKCSFYVGTCSWPSIASIFLKNPKFIILRGPSIRRWDFESKFSEIIRKGPCQSCQYTSLECVFDKGNRTCMKNITVEDVIETIKICQ